MVTHVSIISCYVPCAAHLRHTRAICNRVSRRTFKFDDLTARCRSTRRIVQAFPCAYQGFGLTGTCFKGEDNFFLTVDVLDGIQP